MEKFKSRSFIIFLCIIFGVVVVLGKLSYIQIFKGKEYSKLSQRQSERRKLLTAKRGTIRDCHGRELAKSVNGTVPYIYNDTVNDTTRVYNINRVYPYSHNCGQVIGYLGKDGNGLGGIEFAFNDYLEGEDGWSIDRKDGRSRQYPMIDMPKKQTRNGDDVYLTIDMAVQKIVENLLIKAVRENKAKSGMAIVMDPYNGNIIAMANVPSFNPNIWRWIGYEHKNNLCINLNYEPGSTFKAITASAALTEKIMDENTIIDANEGVYHIYDQIIRDTHKRGKLSFTQAMMYSSNVCFAKIADEVGNKLFYKNVLDFGFGKKTDIELPGEEVGIVRPIKSWSGRTRVTMAIGQELYATFLQMMTAFSSIANGGVLVKPHILQKVVSPEGNIVVETKRDARRRVLSKDNAYKLRKILQTVVDSGTAKDVVIPHIPMAGKTGTSQMFDRELNAYSDDKVWASFMGFAPVDKPVLVCGVVITEPEINAYGGKSAGPVFRDIIHRIISHPEIDYGKKIVNSGQVQKNVSQRQQSLTELPDFTGFTRFDVKNELSKNSLTYEFIGRGKTVAYQSPRAGSEITKTRQVLLFMEEDEDNDVIELKEKGMVIVPNCIGKNLNEGVNALNVKGIIPYVKGQGVVKEQRPSVGSIIHKTVVCTLECASEG